MSVRIGVVIVAFDSGDYLVSAVESVYLAAKLSSTTVEICVVDNHPESKDFQISSSVQTYLETKSNLGFGAGCNIGIEFCLNQMNSDYVLLLNPDASLKDTFFLELERIIKESSTPIHEPISPLILLDDTVYAIKLSKALNIGDQESITLIHGQNQFDIHDSEGRTVARESSTHVRAKGSYWISSKKLSASYSLIWTDSIDSRGKVVISNLDPNNFAIKHKINNAGSYLNPPYIAGDIGFQDLLIPGNWVNPQSRTVWCGACVLLSKRYLTEVGYFDENFFLYYEDIDLSLRGSKNGYRTLFNPRLVCFHGHSKSTSKDMKKRSEQIWRSRALFVVKNYGIRFGIMIILKLLKGLQLTRLNRGHFRNISNNVLPELLSSFRGVLRIK
jgi:GT2 family glycosyltransferase